MLSYIIDFIANILQSLIFRLRGQAHVPSSLGSPEDKRRFDRYLGPFDNAISVKLLRSSKDYEVKDISYGGLAFVDPTRSPKLASAVPEAIELRILERTIRTKLTILGLRNDATACLFHHESPETLLFLRESLEGFRKGASIRLVPVSLLQEKYRTGQWIYLRGAGPTDILLSQDKRGNLESALVTVQAGERYVEVRIQNGVVETGKSIDREGAPATRMGATEKLDLNLIHHVACIFLTMRLPETSALIAQTLGILQAQLCASKAAEKSAA